MFIVRAQDLCREAILTGMEDGELSRMGQYLRLGGEVEDWEAFAELVVSTSGVLDLYDRNPNRLLKEMNHAITM